eukprot:2974776-Amphidinium_carterae.1
MIHASAACSFFLSQSEVQVMMLASTALGGLTAQLKSKLQGMLDQQSRDGYRVDHMPRIWFWW